MHFSKLGKMDMVDIISTREYLSGPTDTGALLTLMSTSNVNATNAISAKAKHRHSAKSRKDKRFVIGWIDSFRWHATYGKLYQAVRAAGLGEKSSSFWWFLRGLSAERRWEVRWLATADAGLFSPPPSNFRNRFAEVEQVKWKQIGLSVVQYWNRRGLPATTKSTQKQDFEWK